MRRELEYLQKLLDKSKVMPHLESVEYIEKEHNMHAPSRILQHAHQIHTVLAYELVSTVHQGTAVHYAR